MDGVRVTPDRTILAESTRLVPRPLSSTAAAIVLVHSVFMLVDGAAHMRLKVDLSGWANLYVLCIVGIGPIAGFLLLRSGRQRAGAMILFTTIVGALVFGVWKHFIAHGPDHVMHLQADPWRLPFRAAVLLALSEFAGAFVALMLLYALTRPTKARVG